MRTRRSGQTYFIQLHLMLDDEMPLVEAHRVADEVEAAILAAYPNADVLIGHQASEPPPPLLRNLKVTARSATSRRLGSGRADRG